jgi:RimJ/RimL family protein N-acetyltransferase
LKAGDVIALTEWRNRYVASFLTEFTATEARTAEWLINDLGPDGTRILFMIDRTVDGVTIGYMGLAFIDWENHYGEADAVVRGLPTERGVMRQALLTLLTWAQEQLGLSSIGVRVRSDNSALSFYKSLGFHSICCIPLRRLEDSENGMITWVEEPDAPLADHSLVHMQLACVPGVTARRL